MNPGPVYRYPCTICAKPVMKNQRGIGCDRCDRWTHAACCGVSVSEYEQLDAQGESSFWYCPSCINKELPFANVSHCTESESDYAGDTSASQFALFNPAGPGDSLGRESVFRDRRGHLLVCHLNVRSVLPKSDKLHLLLGRQDGVVLGLSETSLDESVMDLEVEIPGFKHFRRDRSRRGGGVMVYVPEQFKVVRRKELEDDAVEALWIEVRTVNMVVLVCNVYRPPDAPAVWFDDFASMMEKAAGERAERIVLGDFNCNMMKRDSTSLKLEGATMEYGLVQVMNCPTRVTETTESMIDLMFTSEPEILKNAVKKWDLVIMVLFTAFLLPLFKGNGNAFVLSDA